jgi:starch synthase
LIEVIADGETGILVPPGDEGALAGAIETLVRDPIAAARMGSAARRRAAQEFCFDRFVVAYERAYAAVQTAVLGTA